MLSDYIKDFGKPLVADFADGVSRKIEIRGNPVTPLIVVVQQGLGYLQRCAIKNARFLLHRFRNA